MKTTERPILFSAPMVRAILKGRKTQTRRVVKDPLDTKGGQFCVEYADTDPNVLVHVHNPKCEGFCDYTCHYPCPYGKIGDRLWVRERWAVQHCFDGIAPRLIPLAADEWGKELHIHYAASEDLGGLIRRPSIHMPRWASRITLEVTDVRVQRLQDITDEDAIVEGFAWTGEPWTYGDGCTSPVMNFFNYWDVLNAKRGHLCTSNPWVWAVSFKVVTLCPNS